MDPMWGGWGNEILFQVRKHLPSVRLKPYRESADGVKISQDFFSNGIAENLRSENLKHALFYAWVLDQLETSEENGEKKWAKKKFGRAIDLGSKNFVYAPALCRALEQRFENFELTGLEVDPYRTYIDLYKRGDYARYYSELCSEAYAPNSIAYLPGNWLTWNPPEVFDMIFCFFPFLFQDLNEGWGLTPRHFSPRLFYEKAFFQSQEVIFFHQGSEELEQSLKLIEAIGVGKVVRQFRVHENPWGKRKHLLEVIQWKQCSTKS
jgi:hypothetical protein